MTGKIIEIFESVQGEGIYLGEKQLFVRFYGCNLQCRYCDTPMGHFTEYQPQEILERLQMYKDDYHSVSFTGGEPLLQKDFLKETLRLTAGGGYKNYLETNGTLPEALEDVIDYLDIIAMDFKLPSSTGMKSFWDEHRRFLKIASSKEVFLKAIICYSTKEEDIIEALGLIREINRAVLLVLQPNSYDDYPVLAEKIEKFRKICKKDNVSVCVIPQLHKRLGVK